MPAFQIRNRIITRGFGPLRRVPNQAGPITQGYGSAEFILVVEFRRRSGQSGRKRREREFDVVFVSAELLEINDMSPNRPIKGWIKVLVKPGQFAAVLAERVSSRARDAWELFKVTAYRVM